jgi:hypothetical protein
MLMTAWKRARVIPIYKSEDRRERENYTTISILPIVSKVFEREVFRQLYGNLSITRYYLNSDQGLNLNTQPCLC